MLRLDTAAAAGVPHCMNCDAGRCSACCAGGRRHLLRCVAYVPDCTGNVGRGHSRLFVTFEGVTAIITVYQTARRHMPEERNFVHFYLLLCVYVIVLCCVDKIRNSSNPVQKKPFKFLIF